MTDEQKTTLGKRAVACKRFKWMAGMRYLEWFDERDPDNCDGLWGREEPAYHGRIDDDDVGPWNADIARTVTLYRHSRRFGTLPDLTDPATMGCLLALVREAHNQPHAHVCWAWEFDANHPTKVQEYDRLPRRMWWVDDITDYDDTPATSDIEALIIALEAAS